MDNITQQARATTEIGSSITLIGLGPANICQAFCSLSIIG